MAVTEITVLVVDDHALYRRAMRDQVARTEGFVVAGEAAAGEAVIEMAAVLSPRLVLMDVDMPGIGGIEAARAILQMAPPPHVVLCSTYDYLDVASELAVPGAVYLRKKISTPAFCVACGTDRKEITRSAGPFRDLDARLATPAMP